MHSDHLRALVRSAVHGDAAPALPPDLCWARLREVLFDHLRMLPTLAGPLLSGGLPRDLAREVEAAVRALRQRAAFLWIEMGRAIPHLEAGGISPLVLKGPAIAGTVYPAPFLRSMSDLDLLVPRSSLDRACELLGRIGYRPASTTAHPAFYEHHHFHRILENRLGLRVEVHWDLTSPTDYVRFDVEALRHRARSVDLNGVCARVPAPSDLLLHTASQALTGGFCDPRRPIDGAFLLAAGAGAEPGLAARAADQGLATALWVLLALARDLAGVAVPRQLEEELAPPALARRCLETLDLLENSLVPRAERRAGADLLVRWLCAPGLAAAGKDAALFLLPSEAFFLQRGHHPESLPGPATRTVLSARRALSLLKALAYQSWLLAKPSAPASQNAGRSASQGW